MNNYCDTYFYVYCHYYVDCDICIMCVKSIELSGIIPRRAAKHPGREPWSRDEVRSMSTGPLHADVISEVKVVINKIFTKEKI